ncbi:type VII secretion target [Actinoplanes sp. TFC3]|uniref:type VII secretion target n=1 Tax=Actinoplanes sp. TFC3 TaxID=1710355 RepID=UPI00082E68C3|nr:type VII secretion target [Actinoplanes sp. TFC3]
MADGFTVDASQLRSHAARLDGLRGQFGAVKGASACITGDAAAYGLLCGWISDILEGRHRRQDELVSYAEENLSLLAEALRATAADYELTDSAAAENVHKAGGL